MVLWQSLPSFPSFDERSGVLALFEDFWLLLLLLLLLLVVLVPLWLLLLLLLLELLEDWLDWLEGLDWLEDVLEPQVGFARFSYSFHSQYLLLISNAKLRSSARDLKQGKLRRLSLMHLGNPLYAA